MLIRPFGAKLYDITPAAAPGWPLRAGALVALIALADVLLWQVMPGLSLALFGMVLLALAWALAGRHGTPGLFAALLLFLPVVERVQALSFLFWMAGLALGAAWIALARWPGLSGAWRFLALAPLAAFSDARHLARLRAPDDLQDRLRHGLLGWFVPIGLGLVFLSLLIEANPLLENWADALFRWDLSFDIGRLIFWAGIALLGWPFLRLPAMVERIGRQIATPAAATPPAILNPASIRRSLILFNLVFAVQTLSDLAIFTGGASLPDGMSYAQYAHRGAYPLLVTALLAGAFALAARPFTVQNRALRAALLGWMGQTLLLVFSSLLRLDSYISVYGLTILRLSALVWMGVVAVGIVLVIAQILRGKSARWLLTRCTLLGLATLYLACFTSFSATVARYNLSHDVPHDPWYLCQLDSAALPAIRAWEAQHRAGFCGRFGTPEFTPPADWREWGFRGWRTARSLAEIEAKAPQWPIF